MDCHADEPEAETSGHEFDDAFDRRVSCLLRVGPDFGPARQPRGARKALLQIDINAAHPERSCMSTSPRSDARSAPRQCRERLEESEKAAGFRI